VFFNQTVFFNHNAYAALHWAGKKDRASHFEEEQLRQCGGIRNM
jgi:hypothetical protein